MDKAIPDEVMLVRKNDIATIPLKEAIADEDFDFDEIMTMADQFDETIDECRFD